MTKFSEFPYFVALTGGIACGKSIVGECFKNQNFSYFDSDKASHDCYLPETNIYKKILEMYGKNIIEEDNCLSLQCEVSTKDHWVIISTFSIDSNFFQNFGISKFF